LIADEILVKKAQGGDVAAFGELVRRYQDRVYGLALKMFTMPDDARDASQEIFLKVFRALPGYDFRASFATWLYRVSTNVCLDMLRQRGKEKQRHQPLKENKVVDSRPDAINPGPEESYLEGERARALKSAVESLPNGYRMALLLHHYQGLSYRQVAGVMKLPEKTVATRIHRA